MGKLGSSILEMFGGSCEPWRGFLPLFLDRTVVLLGKSVVAQFGVLHARSLAPLVRARDFGMTLSKKIKIEPLPGTPLGLQTPRFAVS